MWDDELDDLTLALLVGAYSRRKRWEAQLLVSELAHALEGKERKGPARKLSNNRQSADKLLSDVGVRI